jgi:hypothetical protein
MNWFRSNLRLGSRLALVALAIQFGLSFGHFHAADRPIVAASAQAAVSPFEVAASVTRSLSYNPLLSKSSSGHEPAGQAGDDCAICAVMALAHAMLVVTPPDLPAPSDARLLAANVAAVFKVLKPVRVAFQPRAPPAA